MLDIQRADPLKWRCSPVRSMNNGGNVVYRRRNVAVQRPRRATTRKGGNIGKYIYREMKSNCNRRLSHVSHLYDMLTQADVQSEMYYLFPMIMWIKPAFQKSLSPVLGQNHPPYIYMRSSWCHFRYNLQVCCFPSGILRGTSPQTMRLVSLLHSCTSRYLIPIVLEQFLWWCEPVELMRS